MKLVHSQELPEPKKPWLSDRARTVIEYVVAFGFSGLVWLALGLMILGRL